jgi:hypothetical protein
MHRDGPGDAQVLLPAGVEPDAHATLTLLYVNNTLYGSRQGLQGQGSGQGPAR